MVSHYKFIAVAVATGVAGVAKSGEAAYKNSQAKKLIKDARTQLDSKKNELDNQKNITTGTLVNYGELKLKIWDEQFSRFISLFSRIKHVKFSENHTNNEDLTGVVSNIQILEIKQLSVSASEIVRGGIATLGVGAIAGVASYGGAMMFASASTGTAIASLSGVAATNATLAWFGGGSLASGGLGMAGGTLVLGGLIAGPLLAVGGLLVAAKAKANLAEAKAKHKEVMGTIEVIGKAIEMLIGIENLAKQYLDLANTLRIVLDDSLNELELVVDNFTKNENKSMRYKIKRALFGINVKREEIDYNELSSNEKRIVHRTSQLVQLTKIVLDKPLLEDEGTLNVDTEKYINEANCKGLLDGTKDE